MANRQDSFRTTASVDGVKLGVFEDRKGGDTDSNAIPYPIGGQGPIRQLGGRQIPEPLTVSRLYDADAQSRETWLRGRCGKGVMVVNEQTLNDEGQVESEKTWTGQLKKVGTTDRAADGSGAEQIVLEMTVESVV